MSGPPDPKASTALATRSEAEQAIVVSRRGLEAKLLKVSPTLEVLLPPGVSAPRFVQMVVNATLKEPALLECTSDSVIFSCLQAAELGLELGGGMQESYAIPWKDKHRTDGKKVCQLLIGYRGWLKLVRQSGEVASVQAQCVYPGDLFEVNLAENAILHRPGMGVSNRRRPEDVLCAYVVFKFKNGEKQVDMMTREEIEDIRKRSKSPDSGPWVTDWSRMAMKTVIRRAVHLMPTSALPARVRELAAGDEEQTARPPVLVAALAPRQLPPASADDDDT